MTSTAHPAVRSAPRPARGAHLGPVAVLAAALLVAAAAAVLVPGALHRAGPGVLVAGLLLGLPHGAADVWRAVGDAGLLRQARVALAYLAAAVLAFAAWWWWPLPALLVLLSLTVLHFGSGDVALEAWAGTPAPRPAVLGLALGGLPVVVPLALRPGDTVALLDPLTGGRGAAVHAVALLCLPVVALAAGLAVRDAQRAGRWQTVAGLVVVAAVVALLPPLVAFGVYFAGWHALRQTCRQLDEAGAGADLGTAARRLALRAGPPTVAALLLLAGVVAARWSQDGWSVPTALVAALLAVTVPHAAVGLLADHRARP
ncbi:hypothetical protein GCM10027047_10450 [Rhodococcus aerolatus]